MYLFGPEFRLGALAFTGLFSGPLLFYIIFPSLQALLDLVKPAVEHPNQEDQCGVERKISKVGQDAPPRTFGNVSVITAGEDSYGRIEITLDPPRVLP